MKVIIEDKSSNELTEDDLKKVNCLKCRQMLELLKVFELYMDDSNISGSLVCDDCENSILISEDFDAAKVKIGYVEGNIYEY